MLASFVTIFLAELGDKTQLAALSFSTNTRSPWSVFIGTSLALVCTTALAVVFGDLLTRVVPPRVLQIASATMFVLIGLWLLVHAAWKTPEPQAAPPSAPITQSPSAGGKLLLGLIMHQARAFEEDTARLFREIAADLPAGAVREKLEQLAEEELRHADTLGRLTGDRAIADAPATGADLAAVECLPLQAQAARPPAAAPLSDKEKCAIASQQFEAPLQRAIQAEEHAAEYYLALARLSAIHTARDAFRWLAMEEIRHAQELCALVNHPRANT